VNLTSKSYKQKNLEKIIIFSYHLEGQMKIPGFGSVCQRYGSADPDQYQNVTDPQHWL